MSPASDDPSTTKWQAAAAVLAEMHDLIEQLLEGNIAPANVVRLEELLTSDPKLLRYYILYVHHFSTLASLLSVQAGLDFDAAMLWSGEGMLDETGIMPALHLDADAFTEEVVLQMPEFKSSPPPQRHPTMRWLAFGAAACVTIIMGCLWLALAASRHRPPLAAAPATQPAAVKTVRQPLSVVVSSLEAVFETPAFVPAINTALPSGDLSLRSGFLRLRLASGADVIIEGPARFAVQTANRIALASGRLVATVPPPAAGLTVVTPTATLVDYGTEFGVATNGGAVATDVEVFQGLVSVAGRSPATAPAKTATTGSANAAQLVMLRAGEAAVSHGTSVSRAPAEPQRFVRSQQFDRWQNASPNDRFAVWQAYSQRLSRDPTLALYYSFEGADPMTNTAVGTLGRGHARFLGDGGPSWVAGRWPGKHALDLTPSRPGGLLVPDFIAAPSRQMTLAAWVNCRSLTPYGTIAKNWGDGLYGQFHLGISPGGGALEAQVKGDPKVASATVRDDAKHPLPLNRWTHVALVADGRTMTLYRDGVAMDHQPSLGPLPNTPIPSMSIGFKTNDPGTAISSKLPSGWDGQIDELAFWHRALSPGEIMSLVKAGQP